MTRRNWQSFRVENKLFCVVFFPEIRKKVKISDTEFFRLEGTS